MNDARHNIQGSKVQLNQAVMQYLRKDQNFNPLIQHLFGVTVEFQVENPEELSCVINSCDFELISQVRQHIQSYAKQLEVKYYNVLHFQQLKAVAHSDMLAKLRKANLWVGWHFNEETKTLDVCGETIETVKKAYQIIVPPENKGISTGKLLNKSREVDRGIKRRLGTPKSFISFSNKSNSNQQDCFDLRQKVPRLNSSGQPSFETQSLPPEELSKKEQTAIFSTEPIKEIRIFRAEVLKYLKYGNSKYWKQINELLKKNNVEITIIDSETSAIDLTGQQASVFSAFEKIHNFVENLAFDHHPASKLFQQCFTSIECSKVASSLQDSQLPAGWDIRKEKLYVCSNCKPSAKKALKVIQGLVVEKEYPANERLSPDKVAETSKEKWKSFVAGVCIQHGNDGLQLCCDDATSKINFALLSHGNFEAIIRDLDIFFKTNQTFQESVNFEEEETAKLFSLKHNQDVLQKECFVEGVVINIDLPTLEIRSQSLDLIKTVKERLQRLVELKVSLSVSEKRPSFEAWLTSVEGQKKLKDICSLTQTVASINYVQLSSSQPPDPTLSSLEKMHVIQGDISTVEADGIISSQGAIARVLQSKFVTGPLIPGLQRVCMSQNSTNRPPVHIFHIHTDSWNDDGSQIKILGDKIEEAFQSLQSSGSKVIAIPAIGTGALHYPADEAAAAMIGAVINCCKKAPLNSGMKKAAFVIHPSAPTVYEAFTDELQATKLKSKISHTSLFPEKEATVTFTGLQRENAEEAKQRFYDDYNLSIALIDESSFPQKKAIPKLTQQEVNEIYTTAIAGNIDLEIDQIRGKIKLQGLKEDVNSLKEKINNMLWKKVAEMKDVNDRPSHWVPQTTDYLEVILPKHSPEYAQVSTKFMQTSKRVNIMKIIRIQNQVLHTQYGAQKMKIVKEVGSSSGGVVERQLWHGTLSSDVKHICTDRFDRSYAGKNGTAYGVGTYFATTSDYSIGYCKDSLNKCIILAKVATGKPILGNPSMKSVPKGYHSMVDNQSNPTIFVVDHDAAAYPDYVIHYQLY